MKDLEEYWSHYWENDGKDGEVFVNSQGERPGYLSDHWIKRFASMGSGNNILDIASGAGSIFDNLSVDQRAQNSIFACDISSQALAILKKRMPETKVLVCSSLKTPFLDESFDLVVSQFGIDLPFVERL